MSIEVRKVENFDEIRFRGPGILKITQCDEESLTLHAPRYVIDDIESTVDDGVLRLGYVSPKVTSLKVHREVLSYDLKLKDLLKISISGSGRALIPDLDNDHLTAIISGSGKISLGKLTADHFEARVSGSGSIVVSGDVETQAIVMSGSENLISDFSEAKISGSGCADLTVSDELSVVISGSGSLSYSGYPDIYKKVSGSGKVTRRRKESKPPARGKEHG